MNSPSLTRENGLLNPGCPSISMDLQTWEVIFKVPWIGVYQRMKGDDLPVPPHTEESINVIFPWIEFSIQFNFNSSSRSSINLHFPSIDIQKVQFVYSSSISYLLFYSRCLCFTACWDPRVADSSFFFNHPLVVFIVNPFSSFCIAIFFHQHYGQLLLIQKDNHWSTGSIKKQKFQYVNPRRWNHPFRGSETRNKRYHPLSYINIWYLGLRKKVKVFMQPNYTENFVQVSSNFGMKLLIVGHSWSNSCSRSKRCNSCHRRWWSLL